MGKGEDPIFLTESQIQDQESNSKQTVREKDAVTDLQPPVSFINDPELIQAFVSEAGGHLDALEEHLLKLENDTGNEELLHAVFRAFHTVKGNAGLIGQEEIAALAHAAENILAQVREGKRILEGDILELIFATLDSLKGILQDLLTSSADGKELPASASRLALIQDLQAVAADKHISNRAIASEARGTASGTPNRDAIKVDAERLDRLLDAIGEMVIAQSMISQAKEIRDSASPELARQMNHLDKITRELQQMATSLRMVPVGATFNRMARLVRDLAKKAGKEVNFTYSGEDTELDKTMVDNLSDPLVHLLRNAVDHGLEESGEERRLAGKTPVGNIHLRAYHQGGNIYIEVADDGRGLNRDAILARARERNLGENLENLSDDEVRQLIFAPGFSTAPTVTEVSGRGVGLDVVKRAMAALQGQVEVKSEKGRGAVFTLRLPLTLAIIDGMVARVGQERYIIPTLSVVKSFRPSKPQLSSIFQRQEILQTQGEIIPLMRLHRLFHIAAAEEDALQAQVIIVEEDHRRVGIMVDELVGRQQIVIKGLYGLRWQLPEISGGAIMSDGRVGLILNVGKIVQLVERERMEDNLTVYSEPPNNGISGNGITFNA